MHSGVRSGAPLLAARSEVRRPAARAARRSAQSSAVQRVRLLVPRLSGGAAAIIGGTTDVTAAIPMAVMCASNVATATEADARPCPLYPQKRTFAAAVGMSA